MSASSNPESKKPSLELEPIAPAMRRAIGEYSAELQRLAGANLLGLTFFGRVVSSDFSRSRHAAQNVLVLSEIDLDMLRELAPEGEQFGRRGVAAPIMMTPAYIADSLDTFALELIEIHQRRATVLGRDYFSDLEFHDEHVRLQCERELKTALIRLRQGLLAAAGREKQLGDLSREAAAGLVRVVRGLLWLQGTREHLGESAAIEEVEKLFDQSFSGLRSALQEKAPHDWMAFVALYHDVQALQRKANAL